MKEDGESPPRKIIHCDMDAFYASVEQRDNPSLRGVPVAVGGSAERGVVAAASYEARRFGVRSAMPSVTAARRCPALVFVRPRFEVYREVSQQIRRIFRHYSDLVEPLSLDEAYLDVTQDKQRIGSAMETARRIKARILRDTGLTASAGVSYNKFLAKIASDQNKPDGIFLIRPREGAEFVATLPVHRFHGVGPRTAEKMARLGIHVGADLRAADLPFLAERFGKSAVYLYNAARGVDRRPVRAQRMRKSVGKERTYPRDLASDAELIEALEQLLDSVWSRIEDCAVIGRTVTLKVRYANFQQITRSRSGDQFLQARAQFERVARGLLGALLPVPVPVRLLGVTLSGLADSQPTPSVAESDASGVGRQGAFEF